MNNPTPRSFRPALAPLPEPSVIESAVNEHSKINNVPSVVKPSDARAAVTETVTLPVNDKAARVKKTSPSMRFTCELPNYVVKELGRRVLEQGGTKKFHLLKALQSGGFTVKDVDLYEDGRRGR